MVPNTEAQVSDTQTHHPLGEGKKEPAARQHYGVQDAGREAWDARYRMQGAGPGAFQSSDNFSDDTRAYCIIVHDRVLEY